VGEVTHTDKGNGVQMSFYTSLYTWAAHVPFGSEIVCTRFDRGGG